jgi:glutamyl-tRNA synthetase
MGGEATILVAHTDLQTLESQQTIRLMGLFNLGQLTRENKEFRSRYIGESSGSGQAPIIQWVPSEENVKVQVVQPDASITRGLAEQGLKAEKIGAIIQFIRIGFCRVDAVTDDVISLYFAHQ